MLWLCPACIVMQVLQEKCTIRIILHYNATEGGMDNLDHLSTMYTTRRKVNRWHVVLFGNCIDVGAVAAFIIWLANFPEWRSSEGRRRRRLFLLELAHGLIMPQVRRRSLIPTLQALIRLAMKMVLELLVSHRRLNRQWVLSRGECVASVLVKLTRKLGWKVGYAENLYVPITTSNKLCGNNSYKSRAHIH